MVRNYLFDYKKNFYMTSMSLLKAYFV